MELINCPECGKEFTDEMLNVNMCFECGYIIDKNLYEESPYEIQTISFSEVASNIVVQQKKEEQEMKKKMSQHLVVSGYNFEGYKIIKYNGVISGQVVMGTGLLNEVKASFSDILGVQAEGFSCKLEQAKELAMKKMIEKSISIGGNAIIGIDFDYITFANNMLGVSVNGTSVNIDKVDEV